MTRDCQNLDAYLLDELSTEDAARFADHLYHCDECREAADEQRWIDGVLRSSATNASETPPDNILASLRSSIARRTRRNRFIACGLAAAATIVVALGWTSLNRQVGDQLPDGSTSASVATGETSHAKTPPRATFVASSNVIAVPVASRHPNVTVVRIYPTYQPRNETQTARLEPEATTYDSRIKDSNGG